jgi:hypothetical protein
MVHLPLVDAYAVYSALALGHGTAEALAILESAGARPYSMGARDVLLGRESADWPFTQEDAEVIRDHVRKFAPYLAFTGMEGDVKPLLGIADRIVSRLPQKVTP